MPKTVIVFEGWRFVPHSYALTSQYASIELLKRADVELYHRDVPLARPDWKQTRELCFDDDADALAAIPPPPDGLVPDAVVRSWYPFDFTPSAGRKTYVWGTTETGVLPRESLLGVPDIKTAMATTAVDIITTSNWAREGFLRSGAKAARVHVLHLGADIRQCRVPSDEERRAARKRFVVGEGFVFLNIGAMTQNKGLKYLFAAFAKVVKQHPESTLLLKGLDALYGSKEMLKSAGWGLSPEDVNAIVPRITYVGETLSAAEMAMLYFASDAYACPYVAEGFNMPALEAAACGLPVITTKGGSTDDFMSHEFALKIPSRRIVLADGIGFGLEPNVDQLAALMRRVITDDKFRAQARVAGPAHVASKFTWRHTAENLLKLIRAQQPT